jgi:hypothetical protein
MLAPKPSKMPKKSGFAGVRGSMLLDFKVSCAISLSVLLEQNNSISYNKRNILWKEFYSLSFY